MTTINLSKGSSGGSSTTVRVILPTDMYAVQCMEAALEDDTFAKPDKLGMLPQKIKTVWEILKLTDEQEEAALEAGEEWDAVRIWHRFNPYYGPVKEGGPSKFQQFIDLVRAQGFLAEFSLEDFNPESLVGIKLKASIERYILTMGPNVGNPGNKITAWAPLRAAKKAAKKADEAEGDLF